MATVWERLYQDQKDDKWRATLRDKVMREVEQASRSGRNALLHDSVPLCIGDAYVDPGRRIQKLRDKGPRMKTAWPKRGPQKGCFTQLVPLDVGSRFLDAWARRTLERREKLDAPSGVKENRKPFRSTATPTKQKFVHRRRYSRPQAASPTDLQVRGRHLPCPSGQVCRQRNVAPVGHQVEAGGEVGGAPWQGLANDQRPVACAAALSRPPRCDLATWWSTRRLGGRMAFRSCSSANEASIPRCRGSTRTRRTLMNAVSLCDGCASLSTTCWPASLHRATRTVACALAARCVPQRQATA